MSKRADNKPLISIVIPVFNEGEMLRDTWSQLQEILGSNEFERELIFINDGSDDASEAIIRELHERDASVSCINLSRNFGKEYALTAGIDFARGDALILMDADLQDPPGLIPDMLKAWQQGFDVVTMRRTSRAGESAFKRASAWLYYRLLNRISDVPIPPDTGDFRLLSRRAAAAVRELPERVRYMKGIFAWIGFRQKEIPYQRASRAAGQSKWGTLRLFRLALDGITAFSTLPLRLASYIGFVAAFGAFTFGLWTIAKTLLFGEPVAGFPSIMTAILFLGGLQLMAIGMLGEYLGRLFTESKQRPHYLVRSVLSHRAGSNDTGHTTSDLQDSA